MNPNSLDNLKKNPIITKYGPLKEGQVSHMIRVRITEEAKQQIKGISPERLGEIIMRGLSEETR